jgi:glycosyltransferase involved in cell wall biosynthesis
MTPPSVSVVICAYTAKRWDDLLRAVRSVEEQVMPPDQIVVVIDHNARLFEQATSTFRDAVVIENAYDNGLSGARNTGIEAATGDVIAFLDDDAAARPEWLSTLLPHYAVDEVAAVGGFINAIWPASRPWWLVPEYDWVVGCSYVGLPIATSDVRNLIGANMSFRHEVFKEVGGFADSLGRIGTIPAGCEETELCIRVHSHEPTTRIVYEPAAVVDHYVGADRLNLRYFLTRCYREGVSKAKVARLADNRRALATEKEYVCTALRHAAVRELRRGAIQNVGLIVTGVALAGVGFVKGRAGSG